MTTLPPHVQFFDTDSRPLVGGTVHIREQGPHAFTVMASSWRDPECEIYNCNPVMLDSKGCARIFLKPGYYDIEVRSADGRVIPGPRTVVVPNPPHA